MNDQPKRYQKLAVLSRTFTPGSPVQNLGDFAGRWDLIGSVYSVLNQRGQHVALFGNRGVGKTSLANILGESFAEKTDSPIRSARYPCASEDKFNTLWRGLFRKLGIQLDEDWIASPSSIVEILSSVHYRPLLVIDELDRFDDQPGLSLLADTIKALSDDAVRATVVLVGVSESIDQLIGDHQSVGRALVQIKVDRMSMRDLELIVRRGLLRMEMVADDSQIRRIAQISEGLPHYTHLLAYHAAESAIEDDRVEITNMDVNRAMHKAIDKAQDSIRKAYSKAVFSPRSDNLFEEVLLAAAIAPKDEVGFFSPKDVRDPLNTILNRSKPLPISAFTRHLKEFSTEDHGSILEQRGGQRKRGYRFVDPMLPPYVLIKGITSGALTEERLAAMKPPEPSPIPDGM